MVLKKENEALKWALLLFAFQQRSKKQHKTSSTNRTWQAQYQRCLLRKKGDVYPSIHLKTAYEVQCHSEQSTHHRVHREQGRGRPGWGVSPSETVAFKGPLIKIVLNLSIWINLSKWYWRRIFFWYASLDIQPGWQLHLCPVHKRHIPLNHRTPNLVIFTLPDPLR